MSYERPPGLPERALTLGSDRTGAACKRRWWFSRGEGLRPRSEGRALGYGTAWHAFLDDVHRWWMSTGGQPYPDSGDESRLGMVCLWCAAHRDAAPSCERCERTGMGPIGRAMASWFGTDRSDDAVVLSRAARGWLAVYGDVPPAGWSVLAVEAPLALPVPSPDSKRGEPYAPELCWVVAPDGRARLARTGEGREGAVLPPGYRAEWERTPAWISVRIDALWRTDRGGLYVQEHKSSGDPHGFAAKLAYDPQVTIYELALEHALAHGHLRIPAVARPVSGQLVSHAAGLRIAGWLYDVSSSRLQRDPKILKSGLMSAAASSLGSVPTWRLRHAMAYHRISPSDPVAAPRKGKPRQAAGPDETDEADTRTWGDVLVGQGSVDAKLYVREFGLSGPEERARATRETYAHAREAAALHRAAALAEPGSADIDVRFPRVPICRGPGSFCPFRGPCLADGPQAREAFYVREHTPVLVPDEPEDDEALPGAEISPWGF